MCELAVTLAPIAEGLKQFERDFRAIVGEESWLIGAIGRHVYQGGGKRMRPAMLLLSHCIIDRERPPVMGAPVAIELIHTATLLHDDVVDESDLRRGLQTVNNGWGNLAAVLMGDYFFAKAFRVMVALEDQTILRTISGATERVSVGEMLQVQEAHNFELNEESYMRIIADKTASLFAAAAKSGAISGGAKAPDWECFERIGEQAGLAFQIADDLLDYTGDEEKTGKAVGNDIREGKITLPLIRALQTADDSSRTEVLRILDSVTENNGFHDIVSFVREQEGFTYAHNKARAQVDGATALLNEYPDSPYRSSLIEFLEYSVTRRR